MWNQKYDCDGYFYGTAPNEWLRMNAHRYPKAGRALAIADGEGRNGVYLASLGFETDSVDSSEVGIAKARELADRNGVALNAIHADLREYPIEPDSLDLVAAIYAHLPADLRRSTHRACAQALRPGGVFVLEAFHPKQLGRPSGGPGNVELLYEVDDILEDIGDLRILEAQSGLTWLDEGRHEGEGYVTRVVAQRA